MKYIDAEKLRSEVERVKESECASPILVCDDILTFIEYLQEEQTEDIVVVAMNFLDVLSKPPYNYTHITDPQIVVKQFLLFIENSKEYNPDTTLPAIPASLAGLT